jgi:hypothetical protein
MKSQKDKLDSEKQKLIKLKNMRLGGPESCGEEEIESPRFHEFPM